MGNNIAKLFKCIKSSFLFCMFVLTSLLLCQRHSFPSKIFKFITIQNEE